MERKILNLLGAECVAISKANGWNPMTEVYDLDKAKLYLGTKIALIHTECSEMMEAIRENDIGSLVGEGIDVLIRTLEFLACLKDVDIDKAFRKKMEFNKKRSYRHGGKLI